METASRLPARRLRPVLLAVLAILALRALPAQVSSAELEEAADVARRAATAALRGQPRILFEALDLDGLLEPLLGRDVWARLTERQRGSLRANGRRAFASALSPPRSAPGEIAWSAAREDGAGAAVFLGLRFADRFLKSRWVMRRAGNGGWRISDVILSDPGVSLGAQAVSSLGPQPVRRDDPRRQARQEAYPRLTGLAVIALVVLLFYRRLPPEKRVLLLLTASAPALLFLIDGALAVRRALAEPYAVSEGLSAPPWERWVRLARDAEREGDFDRAGPLWARALGAGASAGPIAYERGLAARDRGDAAVARQFFQDALEAPKPAPGAFKELALLALARGRSDEAKPLIDRYLESAGPDPDALSLRAIVELNLGRAPEALAAIGEARELVGGGARGAEIEARIRARAADAGGAVAALRQLEPSGGLDREALRADPAYLPIATDPAWIAFLNEAPAAAPPTPAPTR